MVRMSVRSSVACPGRLGLTLVAGLIFGAAVLPTVSAPVVVRALCPAGEVTDDEDAGFECQTQCPGGMLIDADTGICVAPPGVPPPPLGAGPFPAEATPATS